MGKFADLLVKLLPVLAAISGGLWGLYTYIDHTKETHRLEQMEREKDQRNRLLEAQRPFLEKQLALYFETAQIIGQLVALEQKDDPAWAKVRQRFWALYWSELSMVESREVEQAMVQFGEKLTQVGDALNKDQTTFFSARSEMNNKAYIVAHAIRSSIEASWGLIGQGTKPPATK